MKPFEREFYRESLLVINRHPSAQAEFLESNGVSVTGGNSRQPIKPILDFNELDIPEAILNKILDARYERPTPIQSLCWPTLLSGYDLVGIAQTGSGKTLGFILPMLIHISKNVRYLKSVQGDRNQLPGPMGVVLAPTRELAIQIQQVVISNFFYNLI
jgi:superfamily II DNA/RNA helicase